MRVCGCAGEGAGGSVDGRARVECLVWGADDAGVQVTVWRDRCVGTVGAGGLGGRALTMEGPEVVVPEVHQVLQGGVKLLHDALGPEAKGREDEDWERERKKGTPPPPAPERSLTLGKPA